MNSHSQSKSREGFLKFTGYIALYLGWFGISMKLPSFILINPDIEFIMKGIFSSILAIITAIAIELIKRKWFKKE